MPAVSSARLGAEAGELAFAEVEVHGAFLAVAELDARPGAELADRGRVDTERVEACGDGRDRRRIDREHEPEARKRRQPAERVDVARAGHRGKIDAGPDAGGFAEHRDRAAQPGHADVLARADQAA